VYLKETSYLVFLPFAFEDYIIYTSYITAGALQFVLLLMNEHVGSLMDKIWFLFLIMIYLLYLYELFINNKGFESHQSRHI
jgi:Mn2+/Fe2+ NRAMP family transporter